MKLPVIQSSDRYRRVKQGAVLYRGPSALDPSRQIVVIAVGFVDPSTNDKTGGMIQTYILDEEKHPFVNVLDGTDTAICGDCPLRGRGGCYVETAKGPRGVWQSYHNGQYADLTDLRHADLIRYFAGQRVRIGAYGDPAACPPHIWHTITRYEKHTGYTHQWRKDLASELRGLVMASVETEHGAKLAKAQGWGTFRVLRPGEKNMPWERTCPNVTHGVQCIVCGLCKGSGHITVPAHGAKRNNI